MSIQQSVKKLHNASASNTPCFVISRDIYLSYSSMIPLHHQEHFLVETLRQYDLEYNISLFLAAPELWREFDCKGWQNLLLLSTPRPDSQQWDQSELLSRGEYADIHFLIRWMRIDAIQLIMECKQLPIEEKTKILI